MNNLYSKEEIINLLYSKDVFNFLIKYNINTFIMFGSIITSEFTEESDVDLCVIGDINIKLDDILNLELFFESLLNRKIDVVDLRSNSLDLLFKVNILNNCKIIYSTDNNRSFNLLYDEIDRIYKENENFMYFRKVDLLS